MLRSKPLIVRGVALGSKAVQTMQKDRHAVVPANALHLIPAFAPPVRVCRASEVRDLHMLDPASRDDSVLPNPNVQTASQRKRPQDNTWFRSGASSW